MAPSLADLAAAVSYFTLTRAGLLVGVVLVAVICYRRLLPKPLPGIPYRQESSRRILGDLPNLIQHLKQPNAETSVWFSKQCQEQNAPLVQVFLAPLSKPLLVLADHRESVDILMRRHAEFDRAQQTTEFFSNLVPQGTIALKTHDHFKTQRRIWQPTMGTEFIRDVSAGKVHSSAVELLDLWRIKADLAHGHPFAVGDDVRFTTMDAIWDIAAGKLLHAIQTQVDGLRKVKALTDLTDDVDEPANIPILTPPASYTAFGNLLGSLDEIVTSPVPKLYQWVMRRRPWFKAAWKIREESLIEVITERRRAFEQDPEQNSPVTSALDLVLRRELANSLKENRKFDTTEEQLKDELFTYLLGGWETTATTLQWWLLYMAMHPTSQSELRAALRVAFPHASPTSLPTAGELGAADIPYLDAMIAETLRCSRTAGGCVRMTVTETTLLGHRIPKNTSVLMPFNGEPYLFDTPLPSLSEASRSKTSQAAELKAPHQSWAPATKQEFNPHRWLRPADPASADGAVIFDEKAGPSIPFSLGPRGCFGVKLAKLELRTFLTLLILAFEILPLPDKLTQPSVHERVTRRMLTCHARLKAL